MTSGVYRPCFCSIKIRGSKKERSITTQSLKDYFRSDLMCNRDIKGQKFVYFGVEFLPFNVLLHTKSKQKFIGNGFFAPIIFKNPLKPGFSIRNILLQLVSGVFGL